MKLILTLSLSLMGWQAAAAAAPTKFKCKNEAHSAVTASMTLTADRANLQFGSGSNQGSLEEDIKNKSMQLKYNADGSSNGWVSYLGDTLVYERYQEYRQIEVRLKTEDLEHSPVSVKFYISDPFVKAVGPMAEFVYGMSCSQ